VIVPGGAGAVHRLEFLLGLPALADTALWRTALRLGAPVLVSANALSTWRTDQLGLRRWCGFSRRTLPLVAQHPVSLDSGGFVAAVRYRGYPWTVAHYTDLAAAAPWQRWFSLDLCVEDDLDDGQGRARRPARQGARSPPLLRSPLPLPIRRSRIGSSTHGALRHDQAPVYRPRT